MTHKNPFEIRAEMLQMAKDYMDQQWSMNIQLANDLYEQGHKTAEEVNYNEDRIFGEFDNLDITTGASNDLKQATDIARNYINLFGINDDYCIFDSSPSQPFVGRELGGMNSNKISDKTKSKIDNEVEKIVNFAYKQTLQIIDENIKALNIIANKLVKLNSINQTLLQNVSITY